MATRKKKKVAKKAATRRSNQPARNQVRGDAVRGTVFSRDVLNAMRAEARQRGFDSAEAALTARGTGNQITGRDRRGRLAIGKRGSRG